MNWRAALLHSGGVLTRLGAMSQTRAVHHHLDSREVYLGLRLPNHHKSNRNTHMNEKKYRRLRGLKVAFMELPDDVETREQKKMSPADLRVSLLKKGINPYKEIHPRDLHEHQITFQSFYGVVDAYIPPETREAWTSVGAKLGELKDRGRHSYYSWRNGTRRIKRKEGFEFNKKTFGSTAERIYTTAHQALMERNKELLHKYITENAFLKLWPDVEKGSVNFQLLQFNEPSRVVSVRCADNPQDSGNDIAQVIVRMHSTQKLAMYDRFGQLLLGSEDESREIVEYVVFENHIASEDGAWRLHDKVYPEWTKPKQGVRRDKLLDFDQGSEDLPLMKLTSRMEEREKEEREKLARKG